MAHALIHGPWPNSYCTASAVAAIRSVVPVLTRRPGGFHPQWALSARRVPTVDIHDAYRPVIKSLLLDTPCGRSARALSRTVAAVKIHGDGIDPTREQRAIPKLIQLAPSLHPCGLGQIFSTGHRSPSALQ